VSKYKLWKTLHELGFKYAKINGNKKALVKRKNLAKNRINGTDKEIFFHEIFYTFRKLRNCSFQIYTD
jgi:hypothetical protein